MPASSGARRRGTCPGASGRPAAAVPGGRALSRDGAGGPFFSVPSVLYLKAATASYLIPVNWSVAKTWYDTHMAAAGYSSTGSGGLSFGNSPFARSVTLFYQSKANPLLTVDIGFPDMSAMEAPLLVVT